MLRNCIFWLFLAVTTLIGALAVTVILFMLSDNDWDVFEYLDRSLFEHVFISIPYFWIAILALFSLIAYYSFKHTRHGYRYEMYKVVAGSLLLSLAVGAVLFRYGLDSEIHEIFSRQVPFYNNLVYTKEDIWIFPDKGVISGEIVDIKNKRNFKLRDFDGNIWRIQGDDVDWPDNFAAAEGVRIKLIGERRGEHLFFVKIVKPWD